LTAAKLAWRLLIHAAADGAWNMAVDEAILDSCVGGSPPFAPTIRLYGWSPAALSLGRFQEAGPAYDPVYLRESGIDLVRRPTGGSAVLHEFERTYAVVARLREGAFPGGVLDTYRRVAAALCAAMRELGLEAVAHGADEASPRTPTGGACFGARSAHEIAVSGRKLVGSAQLRRHGAFLQHGSVLMRADPVRMARAMRLADTPRAHTDLTCATGHTPDPSVVDRALVRGFESTFSVRMTPASLTARETERATRLRARKYLSEVWTREGRHPRER
jgi:lipoate-protein ligase A